METRDQWYKPNLLYNIHYRPPKKPEPPKMIVETVQFNPSVCTCGEHGCQPQYRMERRVLWTNKEVINTEQQTKINDRENKNEYKESKFEQRITKQDRDIGNVTESKEMELKEENDQEFRFMIEDDGSKCGSVESLKERVSGDGEVMSGYNAFCAVDEKRNVQVEDDDDNDDVKEEEKKVECVCKNEVGYSNRNDDIFIDDEASNTNNVKENNSNARSGRDNFEGRNSEGINGEKNTRNENVEIASAFGIMSIYCNSELHRWLSFEGEDA